MNLLYYVYFGVRGAQAVPLVQSGEIEAHRRAFLTISRYIISHIH